MRFIKVPHRAAIDLKQYYHKNYPRARTSRLTQHNWRDSIGTGNYSSSARDSNLLVLNQCDNPNSPSLNEAEPAKDQDIEREFALLREKNLYIQAERKKY